MVATAQAQRTADLTRLTASLHSAQAQGLLRDPRAVESLVRGIAHAIAQTVEGNTRDPAASWALQSSVYWDYFEMDIKEALLGPFSGLEPALCEAVRQVIEATLTELRRAHLYS
jgi:hypothetical protein